MGSCDTCSSKKENQSTNQTRNASIQNMSTRNTSIQYTPSIPKKTNIITQSELLRIKKTYQTLFTVMGQKKTIGRGGQAKIRKYYSPKFKKIVVEKVIDLNMSRKDGSEYKDFMNKINLIKEAILLFTCDYPNVVKIYDFIEKPITIVMEYCDKGSLRNLLDSNINLPFIYKIFLIYSICDGLGYIHTQGIIHGDLKCANILLSTEKKYFIGNKYYPVPKIADFGLSQIQSNKIMGGTPGYIAPEIYEGSGLTKKSDIFALGMVMFEILSGLQPLPSNFDLAMKFLAAGIPPCTKEVLRIAWEKRSEALLPGINNVLYDTFYTIMIFCINDDPNKRPVILDLFLTIKKFYDILKKNSKEKIYDETEYIKRL